MSPEERSTILGRLSNLPAGEASAAAFAEAMQVAADAEVEAIAGEQLAQRFAYALGLEERPAVDWEGLTAQLVTEAGGCSVFDPPLKTASPGDRERLLAGRTVCEAIETAETTEDRRRFLYLGALSEDPGTRAAAIEVVAEEYVAPAEEAGLDVERRYESQRLHTVTMSANMSRPFVAGYSPSEIDAYNQETWGIAQGAATIRTVDYHVLMGTNLDYERARKKRKRKMVTRLVAGGGLVYAGLVGFLLSPLVVDPERVGATPYPTYAVAGTSIVVAGVGGGLLGSGFGNLRANRYEKRYPSMTLDRSEVDQRLVEYNAELKARLEERAGLKVSAPAPSPGVEASPGAGDPDEIAVRDDDRPLRIPRGQAAVVFVQPATHPAKQLMVPVILDTDGTPICQAHGPGRCTVVLPPGEHAFTSWSRDTPRMEAKLLPDHVYYVLVRTRAGKFRMYDFETSWTLERIPHDSPSLSWRLDQARRAFWPNPVGIAGHVERRGSTAGVIVQEGALAWESLNEGKRAQRTLLPEDGRPATEDELVTE